MLGKARLQPGLVENHTNVNQHTEQSDVRAVMSSCRVYSTIQTRTRGKEVMGQVLPIMTFEALSRPALC